MFSVGVVEEQVIHLIGEARRDLEVRVDLVKQR